MTIAGVSRCQLRPRCQLQPARRIHSPRMMGRLWQDEAQPLTRVRPSPPLLRQCAFVSERTYELCAALRRRGVLLAIVTGARAGTLLQRAPLLPAADGAPAAALQLLAPQGGDAGVGHKRCCCSVLAAALEAAEGAVSNGTAAALLSHPAHTRVQPRPSAL